MPQESDEMSLTSTNSFLDLAKLLESLTKGIIIRVPRKAALNHFIDSELTILASMMKGGKPGPQIGGKVKVEERTARRA
jgi:hypothetical protein